VAISISFFIGTLVKRKEIINAIANVLGMGMAFISGIFVPVELLSPQVLKIGSFTPTYWFAEANSKIYELANYTGESLMQILPDMAVQLGFAVLFWLMTLIAIKKQRVSN
jgi:ABC-2 type transport system permease protein